MEKSKKPTSKLRDNLSIIDENLEKLKTAPSIQDYIKSIYYTLRFDTLDFKNRLSHMGNSLRRIDHTVQKITRIVERQAVREKNCK